MNTDTLRTVEQIKKDGYYRKGTALGAGGWAEVYSFSQGWKTYLLIDNEILTTLESITARDDDTAIKAFGKLFRLDEFSYEIIEKITEFRTVAQA